MGKKLSQKEVEKRIKENFQEEIVEVISEFNGVNENIKVKCSHCGFVLIEEAKRFLDKKWRRRCPRCLKEEKEYFCWKVYEHVFPNGKRYIGITSQLVKDRWDCR